jgi:hypothetical protein
MRDKPLPPWRGGDEVSMVANTDQLLEGTVALNGDYGDDGVDKAIMVAEPYFTEFGYGVRLIHRDDYGKADHATGGFARVYGTVRNNAPGSLGLWSSGEATIVANGISLVQVMA